MADQKRIQLYEGHATPKTIILRPLPVADASALTTIYLYELHATPQTIVLGDPRVARETGGGPSFPTQFFGLKAYYQGSIQDLCLVSESDAPGSMGGVLKVNKNGTLYAVYLVETTDPNASPCYLRTSTGTKAIREKT